MEERQRGKPGLPSALTATQPLLLLIPRLGKLRLVVLRLERLRSSPLLRLLIYLNKLDFTQD